jgi:hypothetical protein
MDQVNRRQFVAGAAASITVLSSTSPFAGAATVAPLSPAGWQAKVRRIGQLNFNEIDPLSFDVPAWMDFWLSLKVDALVVGFGGIMATYPTKVPFHHRSEFLGHRDLTGEVVSAARRNNLRILARMDCNYAYQDALEAHPEWFMRHQDGSPRLELEAAYLFKTCQFSTYFTEQMPAIYREIGHLYAPDAVFTNGWPGTAALEMCYCVNCQKIYKDKIGCVPPPTTDARSDCYRKFYDVSMDRVLEMWKLWDGIVKESNPEAIYFGDLGGSGMQMIKDLKPIGDISSWYAGDHQGRTGDTPIWSCAAQGRIAQSVMDGKKASNIAAAWTYNSPRYRHTSSAAPEMELWLAQTAACGMAPWEHWLGGSPLDIRWKQPARTFFDWMASNDAHFHNRRSLADVAVLYPQRTIAFYRSDGTAERKLNGTNIDPEDYLQGLYYALLEHHIGFDFIHQEKLTPEALGRFRALLIPNAALMRDEECEAIRQYVAGGGSILATFETSRYNEWGDQRGDFALHDLFGVSYAGEFPGGVIGPFGNSYMEIRQPHPALAGFEDTQILPGAEYRVPVTQLNASGDLVLSVIPKYMNAMPELIYPRVQHTSEPAALFRELGHARVAYFPGDIDRTGWRNGHPDFTRLLANSVRWLLRGQDSPVEVEGHGLFEFFSWQTDAGFAIHILNYTNPNMLRPSVREFYPIGPLEIKFTPPAGAHISHARALRSGAELPLRIEAGKLRLTVPSVESYEVIALT